MDGPLKQSVNNILKFRLDLRAEANVLPLSTDQTLHGKTQLCPPKMKLDAFGGFRL